MTTQTEDTNMADGTTVYASIRDLIAQYWDIAYAEGASGVSRGDDANAVLHKIDIELDRLRTELASLREQLETERIRLAACGVVAMSNTPESAAKAREMLPTYWSASCGDVEKAVDREMALRTELASARVDADSLRGLNIALNTMHPDCHKAANAFWKYWEENGETHKRGYYESTWGAINRALRTIGVVPWQPPAADAAISQVQP